MPTKLETQLAQRHVAWPALADGETRLCAVRAHVPSDFRSPLRMLGAVGAAIERAEHRARNPLPFALTAQVAIAVTTVRFVFWDYSGMLFSAPRAMLGELPRAEVTKLELSRRRKVLAFWLAQRSLELSVRDLDEAAAFATAAS